MWGGIKKGRDGLLPRGNFSLCGIEFTAQTGKILPVEDAGEHWFGTGNFEPGGMFPASGSQVKTFLDEIRYYIVRWEGWTPERPKFRRAQVLDTRMGLGRIKEADGSITKTPCLYRELPNDEPLAKYLVLLPATEIANHGGRENVQKMPSIGDLEPSTLEIIKEPTLD